MNENSFFFSAQYGDIPSINNLIEEFGIEKWETIMSQLGDPNKIQKTASSFIPNFLDRAMQIPLN